MYAEERQKLIIEYLTANGRLDVGTLASNFKISRETIRRDLKELESRGLLLKTHGGAILQENSASWYEVPFTLRESKNIEKKISICSNVAKLIANYDNIFLDNSSTVASLIKFLPLSMNLTIITNSTKVLLEIMKRHSNSWTIITTGGQFITQTLSSSGYLAINILQFFKPNKAFMSCHGIDSELDVTEGTIFDAEIKQVVLNSAREKFLLADSTKLNHNGVVKVASVSSYDHVFTNQDADEKFLEKIRKAGVNVEVVP